MRLNILNDQHSISKHGFYIKYMLKSICNRQCDVMLCHYIINKDLVKLPSITVNPVLKVSLKSYISSKIF